MISVTILAGGKSSRMGYDKQLLSYNSHWHMEVLVKALYQICHELIIVTNTPQLYEPLSLSVNKPKVDDLRNHTQTLKIVQDDYLGAGPLEGLRSTLSAAGNEWVLVLPCDMTPHSVGFIIDFLTEAQKYYNEAQLIVWKESKESTCIQPLPGLYRKELVHVMTEKWGVNGHINKGLNALLNIGTSVILIQESFTKHTFVSVNTQEELAAEGGCLWQSNHSF